MGQPIGFLPRSQLLGRSGGNFAEIMEQGSFPGAPLTDNGSILQGGRLEQIKQALEDALSPEELVRMKDRGSGNKRL